jgi:CRP/FNR family cyclic AMP-dependent transcriptional regulator
MKMLREIFDHNPVFASLGDRERELLAGQADHRVMQKGETLALQGELWPYLFVVAQGELDSVKVSSEGRNLLVTTFRAGELFWGPAFFQDGATMLATLEARSAASVYLWPRQRIEPFLAEHGQMNWEICRLMIQRMQRASAILEELAFQPVAGRLARLLLENFKNAGDSAISRQLTLDEIAARIGTTREMVCRILYRFMDRSYIEITRTEFVLIDKDGLARMADGL